MPFEKKYINTEKRITRKVHTISLNDDEIRMVEELKDVFDTHMEGTALKWGAEVGLIVLHNNLAPILKRFHLKRKGKKED